MKGRVQTLCQNCASGNHHKARMVHGKAKSSPHVGTVRPRKLGQKNVAVKNWQKGRTRPNPDLKGLCCLLFCFLAGFCRLNITGRWSLPCGVSVSALSHGAILGETRARSVVLSVSPCRDPRRVGTRVVAGMKMTSPKVSPRAFR